MSRERIFPFKNSAKYDIISKGDLFYVDKFPGCGTRLYFGEDGVENGVVYAMTDGGVRTAVIDVTHPAFAVTVTEAELAAMEKQYLTEMGRQAEMPAAVQEALRNSMLGRGLMAASGTFLDGMSTYLLKLGPENLGDGATAIDRRIAASFPAVVGRLRLADMARLMAEGLERSATTGARRPVCLVNIAGGSGADSWNALIRLQIERSGWLAGRKIAITVLDMDSRAPAFGARAVAALGADGGPLGGLDLTFRYLSYEWSGVGGLAKALEGLDARDAVCGVSSEGGLFEYGSDEEIVENLRVIHLGTASDAIVVGSVTREGEVVRAWSGTRRVTSRPRTLEAFRGLAEAGGWRLEEVVERAFSYNVRMVKS